MASMVEVSDAFEDPDIVDDFDLEVFLPSDFSIFDIDPDLLPEASDPETDPSPVGFQSYGSPLPDQHKVVDPPPPPVPASPDSVSSFVSYIEKFLMEDVDWSDVGEGAEEDGVADFFSGIPLAGLDSCPKSDAENPEMRDALTLEAQSKEDRKVSVLVGVEEEEEEEGDSVSKKRRRQMRNRESAMTSRERKKMYIKDLEMKSKHLDSECRRLEYALRCCMEENVGLRQSLQLCTNRPWVTKQESAVLFLESLLLGSLFWLMSLVCFFLVSGLRNLGPTWKAESRSGRDLAVVVAGTVSSVNKLGSDLKLELWRRRCRGMRGRMKFFSSPLYYAVLS